MYVLHRNGLAAANVCEGRKKRKEKENTVKKTIAPVNLNGRRPSVSNTWAGTKMLSLCWKEKTYRYGGQGQRKACVMEHKDVLRFYHNDPPYGNGCYDTETLELNLQRRAESCVLSAAITPTCSASKHRLPALVVLFPGREILTPFCQQLVRSC